MGRISCWFKSGERSMLTEVTALVSIRYVSGGFGMSDLDSVWVDSPLLQPEHGFGLERYRYRTGERQGRKEKKEERTELICFAPSHASFFRSRLGDTCLHKTHINVS
ncbi:hypothetical protein HID58_084989 [Brassica napus]|uniref:Uncharacterized protein n=1 Tax=Brassica napus TaxID=3708 RepID=A0ABQ7XLJ7_BRANA|nr:hypothetical protein HID58_084989 [Brassica napus]